MTADQDTKAVYKNIVVSSARGLRDRGFIRRGTTFRKVESGNAAIIEFQKSIKSGGGELMFTVNLGVVCGALLEEGQPPLTRAGSINAHLRQRIGMLLPERSDKWWQIAPGSDAGKLAAEVASLISNEAAPYVERYLDTSMLAALWESGKSPGMTEVQRLRYLAQLDAAKARTK